MICVCIFHWFIIYVTLRRKSLDTFEFEIFKYYITVDHDKNLQIMHQNIRDIQIVDETKH